MNIGTWFGFIEITKAPPSPNKKGVAYLADCTRPSPRYLPQPCLCFAMQYTTALTRMQIPECKSPNANPRMQIPECKSPNANPRMQIPECKPLPARHTIIPNLFCRLLATKCAKFCRASSTVKPCRSICPWGRWLVFLKRIPLGGERHPSIFYRATKAFSSTDLSSHPLLGG